MDKQNISIYRDKNTFQIQSKNTDNGLYNVALPLVQKEHVILIDNTTVFNDLIYQPSTGYRQERIKVLGYRSDDWNGSFDIPGFVCKTIFTSLRVFIDTNSSYSCIKTWHPVPSHLWHTIPNPSRSPKPI